MYLRLESFRPWRRWSCDLLLSFLRRMKLISVSGRRGFSVADEVSLDERFRRVILRVPVGQFSQAFDLKASRLTIKGKLIVSRFSFLNTGHHNMQSFYLRFCVYEIENGPL